MAKAGKKPLVDEEVDLIFRKLEPYLKKGLSLHKACLEAQIPKSTAYDLYQEYDEFVPMVTVDDFLKINKFSNRELDFMIRKIFLNFTIKDKIVASYQLNQPFDRFIKQAKIPSSRQGAINLEPLLESILTYWKPIEIDQNTLVLDILNKSRYINNGIAYQY